MEKAIKMGVIIGGSMVLGYGALNYLTANRRLRIWNASKEINDSRVAEGKRTDSFYAVAGLIILGVGLFAFEK